MGVLRNYINYPFWGYAAIMPKMAKIIKNQWFSRTTCIKMLTHWRFDCRSPGHQEDSFAFGPGVALPPGVPPGGDVPRRAAQ